MQLRKVFDQFDTSNNGTISFEEFEAAMEKLNYPKEQMQEIFQSIVSKVPPKLGHIPSRPDNSFFSLYSQDVNKNGHIMYTEFIAAALEAQGWVCYVHTSCGISPFLTLLITNRHIEEERVAEAFDRLDSDDSGYISRQNLRDFLGVDGTTERIESIIKEGDKDNDGNSKCPLLMNPWICQYYVLL